MYLASFGIEADRSGDGTNLRARERLTRESLDTCNRNDTSAVLIERLTNESEDLGRYDISTDRTGIIGTLRTYDETVSTKPILREDRNRAPTAEIDIGRAAVIRGEDLTLSGAPSTDPDSEIAYYDWLLSNDRSTQGKAVTTSYGSSGQYDIELLVTDDDGATARTTSALTVADPAGLPLCTVEGSGTDIYGETNDLFFVYKTLSVDGEMTARVLNVKNTGGYAKGRLMVRDALAEDSPMAATGQTPINGQQYLWALDYGTQTKGNNPVGGIELPGWSRIERSGSTITGYASNDGEDRTKTGSKEVALGEDVYIGLFVNSHVEGSSTPRRSIASPLLAGTGSRPPSAMPPVW